MVLKEFKIAVNTTNVLLTKRQVEVLQLTWNGLKSSEIADTLGISHRTVHGIVLESKKRSTYSSTILLLRHCVRDGIIKNTSLNIDVIELSDLEIEVLQGIYDGLTLKQISKRCFRSKSTISSRLDVLKDKLNVKPTILLIRFALENKLIK